MSKRVSEYRFRVTPEGVVVMAYSKVGRGGRALVARSKQPGHKDAAAALAEILPSLATKGFTV